jgi:hypothetical protein
LDGVEHALALAVAVTSGVCESLPLELFFFFGAALVPELAVKLVLTGVGFLGCV